MSEEGSPGPVTPRRKRTTRMTTGGRKPGTSNPFVDIEAVESGESEAEENLDQYESDFIDDRDLVADDAEAPIDWPRTPSPSSGKPAGKFGASSTPSADDGSGSAKRDHKSKSVPSLALTTPMTTRSRAKNPTIAVTKLTSLAKPSSAADLNTTGYQGSRVHAMIGVKSGSVIPGTDRGDTQRKLETVSKPGAQLTVNMDRAEHEEYMLFINARKAALQSSQSARQSLAADPVTKLKPSGASTQSRSNTASTVSATASASGVSNRIANIPAPDWAAFALSGEAVVHKDPMADQEPASSDNESLDAHNGATPEKKLLKSPRKKSVRIGTKRTRSDVTEMEADESDHSEPEPQGIPGRKRSGDANTVGAATRTPTKAPGKLKGVAALTVGPEVPIAEFERLKETSPAKKAKIHETVLHTVDIKSVRELPDECEVTNPELQDPMMHSIYALDLPNLKRGQVTTWSSNEGPGMFMLSQYPVINPKLSIATVWALLLFVQKGPYINPARIDPRLLEARSPVYTRDGPRKRWVLSIDAKPAVCVSIVNSVQSSLHQISSVYGATSGATPLLKFMTGVHLSQDFDRITGLCGMVFDLELMHVQLNMSALTFGTKGIPIDKFEKLKSPDTKGIKSSSSVYRKHTYTAPTDSLNYDDEVPVYDGRFTGFDASVDIDNLARILPRYDQEIPCNSCTAIAYTVSSYVKSSAGRADEQHLSFNVKWAVVLGEPE